MTATKRLKVLHPRRDTRPTAWPTGLTRRGTWPKLLGAFRLVLTRSLQWAMPLMRKLLHKVRCFHFNNVLQRVCMYYSMALKVFLIWQSVGVQLCLK